jgi:hypothetical protein
MKILLTAIAVAGLSVISARASIDQPGAIDTTLPFNFNPVVTATLPDDSLSQTQPETFTYNLLDPTVINMASQPVNVFFKVTVGDLVLLENPLGGIGRNNWSDVIRFDNNGPLGTPEATVYSWDDFGTFGALLSNVLIINEADNHLGLEDGGPGLYTTYVPDAAPNIRYRIESTVPEPSTCVAGALLLLPFGMSTLRVLRKNRAA